MGSEPLSERIERAALASIHRAAPDDIRRSAGLRLVKIGTTTVSISTADPSTLLNRAIGLGVEEPATRGDLEAVLAIYRKWRIRRYYLHLHPGARPNGLRDWILDAGLEKARGWMKFRRGSEAPPPARPGLGVRRIGVDHAADFGRIVAEGFGLRSDSAALLAALVDWPGWRLYLAFDGATPAAAAAMYLHESAASFGWAATLREYRGRGAQTALLRRRIVDARDAGCHAIFTETGEAVTGDPQHSYKNILRAGFATDYLRENFVPSG